MRRELFALGIAGVLTGTAAPNQLSNKDTLDRTVAIGDSLSWYYPVPYNRRYEQPPKDSLLIMRREEGFISQFFTYDGLEVMYLWSCRRMSEHPVAVYDERRHIVALSSRQPGVIDRIIPMREGETVVIDPSSCVKPESPHVGSDREFLSNQRT